MNRHKGKLIVFEGADGSGTTTQSYRMTNRLVNEYGDNNVLFTREPTNGSIGELLRRCLSKKCTDVSGRAIEMLFRADRISHVERVVRPALEEGMFVVCDRYYPSTLVYQSVKNTLQESIESMFDIYHRMCSEDMLLSPDMVLYLSTELSTMVKRRRERGTEEELFEKEDYQEKVAELYEYWVKSGVFAECKRVRVDGNQGMDKVEKDCWDHVCGILSK